MITTILGKNEGNIRITVEDDNFLTVKARIREQMKNMPLSLGTEDNHNYPASDAIMKTKQELLIKYAPNKI